MNYAFKHPRTGEWLDPVWRKPDEGRHYIGYDLYVDGKCIASIAKGRRGTGWIVLPNPGAHVDGLPDDSLFEHINNWVGPFIDRHAAMEFALWELGYIPMMGI